MDKKKIDNICDKLIDLLLAIYVISCITYPIFQITFFIVGNFLFKWSILIIALPTFILFTLIIIGVLIFLFLFIMGRKGII
ncbi:Uncharacterised protein [Peptostreptococcus anaerobius]|uniref:Uncharacterized protein n=1 Tax=Peptostreptococcus anaerobius TaxID=1261 RepID=A0A379CIS2_9FIRM|nr:hypothetical protein [Peptostreptococcus anaerobius]SFN18586.1 hypothetical protein SAMN05660467_01539 [Peptostreptococcus anaerobius]SUB62128.1 Uncharacterised protein [Peptostreptococcus anaerobius]